MPLENKLDELKSKGLLRLLKEIDNKSSTEIIFGGRKYINFSSNNYLGLSSDSRIKKKAAEGIDMFGVGSGSSRLVAGSLKAHHILERVLAGFKQKERALVFPAGYMANIGLVCSLAGKGDAVIMDRLNHASIIDAAKLSGARIFVYPHKDMDALEKALKRTGSYSSRLLITDSLFSMDGDMAPLEDISVLTEKYGASLMVDEAHATGVFGRNGRGVAEYLGIEDRLEFSMGTLSKALGCQGGFVAGKGELISYLINTARSFIYTTGLAPSICWAACEAIRIIEEEPQRREGLLKKSEHLRKKLKENGFNTLDSCSQIIPVLTGDIKTTITISDKLMVKGIFVPPIRPPTVPEGMCRLRISLSSEHTYEQIDHLIGSIRESV